MSVVLRCAMSELKALTLLSSCVLNMGTSTSIEGNTKALKTRLRLAQMPVVGEGKR